MRGWIGIFVALIAVASAGVWGQGRKPSAGVKPSFTAWAASWDGGKVQQALFLYAPSLEEVDLFAYRFSADDALVPTDSHFPEIENVFGQLPSPRPRKAITLVNDVESPNGTLFKDPACVHRVIATPEARRRHIEQILAIAKRAESIDVDYERVAAEDNAAFVDFIGELGRALHQEGKRLSVVVEPRVADGRTEDPLSNAASTLPWTEIAQAADQLTIMAYLYHYGGSAPGSIAPVDWVVQIATYGLSKVPPEKLTLALHLGGIDWPSQRTGKSLDYDKAMALSTAYGQMIQLDSKTQSGFFSYADGTGKHEVWIETAAGLQAKVKALTQVGIRQIAFWRLGSGEPAFWDHLPRR